MQPDKQPFSLGRDSLSLVAIAVAALAFAIALTLFFAHRFVLSNIVLPIIVPLYAPGRILTADKISIIDRCLWAITPLLALLGGIIVLLLFIYNFYSCRLDRHDPELQPQSPLSISLYEVFFLISILVIALTFRIHGITRGLLWDEIATAMYSVEVDSIWAIISSSLVFNNHIAYSLLAYLSESLFGQYEWALRLPALLLGLASICWFWRFTRPYLGKTSSIFATFMFAISPAHIIWSGSARGYSGMILFTLISSFYFLRLLDRSSLHDAVLFVFSSVIAIYFHLYASFVTLVQFLMLIYITGIKVHKKQYNWYISEESFRNIFISSVFIVILTLMLYAPMVPMLIFNIVGRGHGAFNPLFPLQVIAELSGWPSSIFTIIPAVISVVGAMAFWKLYAKECRYFIVLLVFPLLIVWLIHPLDLYTRFFAYFLPYYIILLVYGFVTIWKFGDRQSERGWNYLYRGLSLICLGYLLFSWPILAWNDLPDDHFRDAMMAMNTDITRSTALCTLGGAAGLFQYYSSRQLLSPASMDEFEEMTKKYEEIRCAYHKTDGDSLPQIEIVKFLARNTEPRQFGENVFTYRYIPSILLPLQ